MVSQFISEQALAETYDADTGWETVTQYREATRLREQNPDMARAEIARRVSRPPSAVRGWLAEGKTPRVVTGLRTAHERGWIDVETESERFRALNQLVAWIFSGGGISARRDAFTPHFSVDDPLMLAVLSQHLRWLHSDYRCREYDDPERHLEVVPAEGGSVLGRVLSILGVPRGVKAQQSELALPAYLSTVDRAHRRDFARIYLLNRGHGLDRSNTDGTYVETAPVETYAREVCELFDSVTAGEATLGAHNRVWVSAATVRELASGTPHRSALATGALHGSHNPPTERAVAATFRRDQTPGGYRYHQLYQIARERDDSRATLASELGLPESAIQSWRRGSKPYVTHALAQARERDWLTPAADSNTADALLGLFFWLLARGSLRAEYYPVFGASTSAHQERFDQLAETLELSYRTVRPADPNWPTELRPRKDGALLGRVLYALGAPRQSEPQTTAYFPPIVYRSPSHARQAAEMWWLHHGTGTDPLTITLPPSLGARAPEALATLLSERLDWTVERPESRTLVVTDGLVESIQ